MIRRSYTCLCVCHLSVSLLLQAFAGHRGAVTSLAFRPNTPELLSTSTDRSVKLWSVSEMAYVDSLFGHQSDVLCLDASIRQERALTVSRDRTARLWKVGGPFLQCHVHRALRCPSMQCNIHHVVPCPSCSAVSIMQCHVHHAVPCPSCSAMSIMQCHVHHAVSYLPSLPPSFLFSDPHSSSL